MTKLDCDIVDDGKTIRFPKTLLLILAAVIVFGVISWSVLRTVEIPDTYAKTEYVDKCLENMTKQHQIDIANTNQNLQNSINNITTSTELLIRTIDKFEKSVNKRLEKIEDKINKP